MKSVFLLCVLVTSFLKVTGQEHRAIGITEYTSLDSLETLHEGVFFQTKQEAFHWNMIRHNIYSNDSTSKKILTPEKVAKNNTVKIPYTVSHGQFNNDSLFDGILAYYNSRDELIVSKQIKNGNEQEGYILEGELVNLRDHLGRKTGKWITPVAPYWLGKFENSENLFEVIGNIINYDKGEKIDTGFFYNRYGKLAQIFIYSKDTIPPKRVCYDNDGRISSIDYHVADPKYGFVRSSSIYYSDNIPDCIIKKETYEHQNLNFTYDYINCELYSKTSIKEKFSTRQSTLKETHDFFSSSGKSQKESIIYFTTYDEMVSTPIPYTVEIGLFDSNEMYLVHGEINYYNSNGVLIESKKVVDGVVIE